MKLLTVAMVAEKFPFKASWIYAELQKRRKGKGNFPLPHKYGASSLWWESEVEAYILDPTTIQAEIK